MLTSDYAKKLDFKSSRHSVYWEFVANMFTAGSGSKGLLRRINPYIIYLSLAYNIAVKSNMRSEQTQFTEN